MTAGRAAAVALFLACVAGCGPRRAWYRPAGGRALGREGFVGARRRVPPEAADLEGSLVAALGPMRGESGRAEIAALIEFRNKRAEPVRFVPRDVRLRPGGDPGGASRPARVTRGGRPVEGPVEIGPWSEAAFLLVFDLPAEALEAKSLKLSWLYGIGVEEYAQEACFLAAGPELAERSAAGGGGLLGAGSESSSASGVPVLMDVPFVGFLFGARSETRRSEAWGTGLPADGAVPGAWWPLE